MWHAGLLKRKTQNQLKHKLLNTASLVTYISSLETIIFPIMLIHPPFRNFSKPTRKSLKSSFRGRIKKKITSQHPTVECSVSVVAPQISWKQLQMEICSCFMVLLLIPGFCLKDILEAFQFQIRPSLHHCCTVAEVTHCSGW